MKHFIMTLLLIAVCAFHVCALAARTDSLEVSVLTCSDGDIAYTMYGHTALRVRNFATGYDMVFNYGMFNLDEDRFVYKFVKGETDYILGAEPADYFISRYAERGMGIKEQVLNFTQEECMRLGNILLENIQPANRTYRYNWLYDNCTTRSRDAVERAVNGHISYKYKPDNQQEWTPQSARQMLHPTASYRNRWVEFGQNFVLGAEIDVMLPPRESMFLPRQYELYANLSNIERVEIVNKVDTVLGKPIVMSSDTFVRIVPLISTERELLPVRNNHDPQTVDPPFVTFMALFVITLIVCMMELRRHKTFKWIDVLFCVLTGLAGLLVSFLFFFSEHAGVRSNAMVIIFNPLPFLWIPFVVHRQVRILSLAILAVFVMFFIAIIAVGQHVDFAFWPLVSTLLLRVVVNIWLSNQKYVTLQTINK